LRQRERDRALVTPTRSRCPPPGRSRVPRAAPGWRADSVRRWREYARTGVEVVPGIESPSLPHILILSHQTISGRTAPSRFQFPSRDGHGCKPCSHLCRPCSPGARASLASDPADVRSFEIRSGRRSPPRARKYAMLALRFPMPRGRGYTKVISATLLEDLRDAYPAGSRRPSSPSWSPTRSMPARERDPPRADPAAATFRLLDDGRGMVWKELRQFTTGDQQQDARRRNWIRTASGSSWRCSRRAKSSDESRRGKSLAASRWHLASQELAPYEPIDRPLRHRTRHLRATALEPRPVAARGPRPISSTSSASTSSHLWTRRSPRRWRRSTHAACGSRSTGVDSLRRSPRRRSARRSKFRIERSARLPPRPHRAARAAAA